MGGGCSGQVVPLLDAANLLGERKVHEIDCD